MISAYTAGDGRRFWLLGLQGGRMWPDVLRAIGKPEWDADERFATIEARFVNSADAGARNSTRCSPPSRSTEWAAIFDRENVWWAPVQHAHELIDDPVAHAAGGFVDVPVADGDPIKGVASPVDFFGTPARAAVHAAGVRPAHRRGAARARLRLGPHHRTQGSRRNPMTNGVAVVTGASSGIGAATARQLAAAGFDVVLGARRMERLDAIAAEIGGRALQLDVTDTDSVTAFCAQVPECRVLVNNAGGALGRDAVEDADEDEWRWMYDANVMGVMRMTRALLPTLEASGDGHVVMVGSIAGHEAYVGGAGYNAVKYALRAVTKVLRLELLGRPGARDVG